MISLPVHHFRLWSRYHLVDLCWSTGWMNVYSHNFWTAQPIKLILQVLESVSHSGYNDTKIIIKFSKFKPEFNNFDFWFSNFSYVLSKLTLVSKDIELKVF